MSLQLILGGSGSGKSHWLYTSVISEAMRHPEENYIVIVPEQFTMVTQRELALLHPDGGLMNIDVLSFQRLAYRVFEETGAAQRTVLTETGKNLLLRRVASEKQGKLHILGGNLSLPGYISEIKSILSELAQYEITVEDLERMITLCGSKPQLKEKLEDIKTLYAGFLEDCSERFTTAEELLDLFCEAALHSKILRGSTLVFDGFTGFTPVQLNALRTLFRLSPRLQVAVTADPKENLYAKPQEHELFFLSRKTIQALLTLAKETMTPVLDPVLLSGNDGRFEPGSALAFLESHLFRYTGRAAFTAETKDSISLHISRTPLQEVRFAARTISRLVKEQGFRCREIAIITGDLPTYAAYVEKVFEEYEIPCFVDQTVHVLLNPALEFLRGALALVEEHFSYESVFRWLRTGFAGLTPEETDRLENYVLAFGIRGKKRWSQEWKDETYRMAKGEAQVCEDCRRRVMEKLNPFLLVFENGVAPLRDYAAALHSLLVSCGVQQQLKHQEICFRNVGMASKANEYAQIYAAVIRLLDEAVELLGDSKVSRREFSDILEAGFSEARVGLIPPGIDEVHVGDIERTRLNDIKVLFFLGLNDGWVPVREKRGGIVSEREREFLQQSGVELAPTARTNGYIQRFYLYLALTKPSHRLYLSFCRCGGDGKAMRPSYLVAVLRRLFAGLEVQDEDLMTSPEDTITSLRTGLGALSEGLRTFRESGFADGRDKIAELLWFYQKDPVYQKTAKALTQAAFLLFDGQRLSSHTAKDLYGKVLENSVTRLEEFASCAFSHFASYGLKLKEREEYTVRSVDIGNLVHRSLELYSRKLKESPYNWFTVPDDAREYLTRESVKEAVDAYETKVFSDSERNRYELERILRIVSRSVWALQEQVRAGLFVPGEFEVSFQAVEDLESVNIALGENEQMHLKGRIDRIDLYEDEQSVYVKVIDYKSGNTSFDLAALYYGLQLQLVVYLNAAVALEKREHPDKEIIPAGILYYRTKDPIVEGNHEQTPEEINRKILRELRPNGLINSDPAVVEHMDAFFSKTSDVIPVGRKADGSFTAASSVANRDQLDRLSQFVQEKLTEIGREILSGEVAANPYRKKKECACTYCAFGGVCGFDTKLPGSGYRQIEELGKEDVWNRI